MSRRALICFTIVFAIGTLALPLRAASPSVQFQESESPESKSGPDRSEKRERCKSPLRPFGLPGLNEATDPFSEDTPFQCWPDYAIRAR